MVIFLPKILLINKSDPNQFHSQIFRLFSSSQTFLCTRNSLPHSFIHSLHASARYGTSLLSRKTLTANPLSCRVGFPLIPVESEKDSSEQWMLRLLENTRKFQSFLSLSSQFQKIVSLSLSPSFQFQKILSRSLSCSHSVSLPV